MVLYTKNFTFLFLKMVFFKNKVGKQFKNSCFPKNNFKKLQLSNGVIHESVKNYFELNINLKKSCEI